MNAPQDDVAAWPVVSALKAEIEQLKAENFALAAGQCVNVTADEGGVTYCREIDRLRKSLVAGGFTDCGGELWQPPIPKEATVLVTMLQEARAECEALRKSAERYRPLECDECGALCSPQLLPVHRCHPQPAEPAPRWPSDGELLSIWNRHAAIAEAGERRLACMRAALRAAGVKEPAPPKYGPEDDTGYGDNLMGG